MKFKLIIVGIVLVQTQILSADGTDWLCTEEASQKRGNLILSCGIGVGDDENEARSKALDNSKIEFSKVCNISDDCRGHSISVIPKRTSCQELRDKISGFKCYRLLEFTIEDGKSGDNHPAYGDSSRTPLKIKIYDNPDNFQPFYFDQIAHFPKVNVGMTKADVLAYFGAPVKIEHLTFGRVVFRFHGKMCSESPGDSLPSRDCILEFDNNVVNQIKNFSFKYTEDLK